MSSVCQRLLGEPCLLHHSQGGKAPCVSSNMRCLWWMYICIAMARRDFFVQLYQFDPESDPEEEAPEEVQTLWLQQDVSEWLVCLYNVSLFVCVVTFTTMKLMANSQQKLCLSPPQSPNSWTLLASSLSPICTCLQTFYCDNQAPL